ncbi:subtilisin-like protease SBT4.2 isoform X1 [Brassica rapa]|uniref:subtilisin-like protease SBT4.2 isoform X1 n=1 Tax=Brassica campestris TaxID=3711 RepID=UPI00142D7A3B|nr:subtilisin-like protease SBT4.2 isoform X1 [Brassica rapa]
MASLGLILFLSSVLLMSLCQLPTATEDDRKVYIAYMGALPEKASYSPMSHHQNILQEVIELSSVEDCLVRSYGRSFNGFAAKLTESERDKLAGMEGVVSVFPDTLYKPLTTRSYEFMGLGDKSKRVPNIETDIIVGVIDHGIWPESKSFSDEGIGPIPKKWKGVCAGGTNFTCNTKVIGARYYVQDSARDNDSHGSHTASTAAGNIVEGVSMNGLAKGTARGGVPLGRIAIYRVCEPVGCNGASVLAAFDDAIADGVDVITISLGGVVLDLYVDPIAIGSFHAMTRGIVTTAAFGNAGPNLQTGQNVAPWIISVAAGYTDRKFVTTVVNGDAKAFPGKWINEFDLEGQMYPLAYGKTASNSCTEEQARLCASGCLNTVQGKIVVCDTLNNVTESREAGAVGTILYDFHIPAPDPIPLAVLDYSNFNAFTSYVLTSPDPRGTILRSKTVKDNDAPFVASFSSRGPNTLFSDIMKPDITAPGVNILAAYSPMSPTAVPGQSMDYYFMSGTSMACPHVGGVAAYIKTFHPDWSPSAVKSAIMTTAWPMNASKNAEAEFAYGSGHVNPTAAVNPGLVYEISKEDYLNMLCSLDYSADGISILAGGDFTCSEESKVTVRDLNYPSMTALYPSGSTEGVIFTRTVTNVGKDGSTYKAKLSGDPKLNIIVDPETLSFDSSGEKKSFNVTIPYNGLGHLDSYGHMSASLVWSDGSHNVRSPIVVYSITL